MLLTVAQAISTVTVTTPVLELRQLANLDSWLRSLLWDSKLSGLGSDDVGENGAFEVHRLKARLPFSDGQVKIVQGVREVFEIIDTPEVDNDEGPAKNEACGGKIVLIGKHLSDLPLQESFLVTIESR